MCFRNGRLMWYGFIPRGARLNISCSQIVHAVNSSEGSVVSQSRSCNPGLGAENFCAQGVCVYTIVDYIYIL